MRTVAPVSGRQPRSAQSAAAVLPWAVSDFVAELKDGRLLVAEFKDDGYVTNDDAREKRLVGDRWAQTTGQLFVMVEKTLNGMDVAQQIRGCILRPKG